MEPGRPGYGPREIRDDLPPGELARVRAAQARGDTPVVAAKPRMYGAVPFAEWWQSSNDGTTLGMGYRGWGSEAQEYQSVDTTQKINIGFPAFQRKLRGDAMAKEIAEWTKRMKLAQANMAARGQKAHDVYAHLRYLQEVNPSADIVPIIEALARTLPYLYTMSGGVLVR